MFHARMSMLIFFFFENVKYIILAALFLSSSIYFASTLKKKERNARFCFAASPKDELTISVQSGDRTGGDWSFVERESPV